MIKDLLKDSFFYTIATVLSKGISLFILPVATAFLSPKEYGILDFILIFIGLIGVSVGLELHQGLSRFTPEATFKEKQSLVSTTLWATLLIYGVLILFSFIFFNDLNRFLTNSDDYKKVTLLIIPLLLAIKLDHLLKGQLRWDRKVKQYSVISIIYTICFGLFVYLALKEFKLGIVGYFMSQLVATLISLLFAIWLNKQYILPIFSKESFFKLFKFSYPLIFSSLIIVLSAYIDRIMIKNILSLESLGLYGIAYRFASMGTLLLVGVQSGLMPIIYREYKKEETKEKLSEFFNLFYLFLLFVIIGSAFFSKEILILMTNPSYYDAYTLIPILTIAVLFNGMYVFAVGINITKKTKIYIIVGIISLILNVVLNFILTPRWGNLGASIATLISAVICFLIFMTFSQKLYKVQYRITRLVLSSLLTVAILFGYHFITKDLNFELSITTIILKIILFFVLIVGLTILLLGLPKMKEYYTSAYSILKNKGSSS